MTQLERPKPILVIDLFPPLMEALLALLSGLAAEDWDRPTVCGSWSVKDVAQHLLGGDVHMLSRGRDGYTVPAPVMDWDGLVAYINRHNAAWVEATRKLSPRVLLDLLRFTGEQVTA